MTHTKSDATGPECQQPCPHASRKMDCKQPRRCVYEGWDGESYECKTCGYYYKLYYEDMA